MEEKKNEVAKLQDQEKALYSGFQTALVVLNLRFCDGELNVL